VLVVQVRVVVALVRAGGVTFVGVVVVAVCAGGVTDVFVVVVLVVCGVVLLQDKDTTCGSKPSKNNTRYWWIECMDKACTSCSSA
jgi:hypothetical protein